LRTSEATTAKPGEQVGLPGDLLNDGNLVGDHAERGHGLLDGVAAATRPLGRGGGHLARLSRVLRALAHRGAHLLDRGRGFPDRACLFARALGDRPGHAIELRALPGDRLGAGARAGHERVKAAHRVGDPRARALGLLRRGP
jgi:hypothetical protein